MSYCVAHQMPTGPRGCPQCLREEAVARSLESGRFWRWAALVFGGIVLLAGLTVLITPKPQPRRRNRCCTAPPGAWERAT
jgi:hypothetical protein